MKIPRDLLEQLLHFEPHRIPFNAGATLQKIFPDQFILNIASCNFEFDDFLGAGLAEARPAPNIAYHQFTASWTPETDERVKRGRTHAGFALQAENTVLEVRWKEHQLLLVRLTWISLIRKDGCAYIVASSEQVARQFYIEVCRWSSEAHGDILVFSEGAWKKDSDLSEATRDFTLENLILEPSLRDALVADVEQFFKRRELYLEHRVPWKRGILLVGPPGNGKSHAIKALCNRLKVPCLYVRSVEPSARAFFEEGSHSQIATVFNMARQTAPCLLVFEDLDSICTPANRSVLLNELDGFAGNLGVCFLATTNFPEKLDAAITDRPSRFDRKYHFPQPALAERKAYLQFWNRRWSPRLRLTEAGIQSIAEQSDQFSFAYLKELCLACTMAWFNAGPTAQMDDIAAAQVQLLIQQRATAQTPPVPAAIAPSTLSS